MDRLERRMKVQPSAQHTIVDQCSPHGLQRALRLLSLYLPWLPDLVLLTDPCPNIAALNADVSRPDRRE